MSMGNINKNDFSRKTKANKILKWNEFVRLQTGFVEKHVWFKKIAASKFGGKFAY